jgi:hypothetical protein
MPSWLPMDEFFRPSSALMLDEVRNRIIGWFAASIYPDAPLFLQPRLVSDGRQNDTISFCFNG